jgi:uroporphyrinogen-III synthase
MEIRAVDVEGPLLRVFRRLPNFHVAIFISANAVRFSLPWIRRSGGLPEALRLAVVGNATAAALEDSLRAPDILPREGFDSEALLACSDLRNVAGLSILIVRGEGGRPLLGEMLRDRGAEVFYAEVYRRACPDADPAPLLERWDEVQVVSATSNEMLDNLVRIFGAAGGLLLAKPLLVISDRMAGHARNLGFREVLQARHADEGAILEALSAYAAGT